jgi:N-acetylmuramoyl-L-alanine amidase
MKDVKVVYTRKTDRYLTLQERADVVNDHHADLFICVHTNSSPSSSAYGAETYTLGLAKTKANLDVAMRENSVILLEEDYRTKYKGFDPNSVDSYIMFEFMQDKYIDRSIEFSSTIQKEFVSYCQRSDRGVRQAGFWVLHRSACPSVLVELGFISNPAEERYLTSDQGQKEMATAIFKAVVEYKRSHDRKSGRQLAVSTKTEQTTVKTESHKQKKTLPPVEVAIQKPVVDTIKKQIVIDTPLTQKKPDQAPLNIEKKSEQTPVNIPKKPEQVPDVTQKNTVQIPVFKVQLLATNKKLKPKAFELKGVENTGNFIENGLYKYTLGNETDYHKIEKIRKGILSKFPQAFIIAFIGDKKVTPKEALKLIK